MNCQSCQSRAELSCRNPGCRNDAWRPIWWKGRARCTLFNDCQACEKTHLDGKQLQFCEKSWKTCSDQNPPKQSPETRNRLKDDDPFPWRNAFWGALFTMAQAALACQIAPALDTDEDSSSLHFRAWHKGSSESHRRESSKIGPSKKLHRWLRKNIAWNCLEMSLVNIKKSCEDLQALYNWVRPAEFWKRESLHQMKTRWIFSF